MGSSLRLQKEKEAQWSGKLAISYITRNLQGFWNHQVADVLVLILHCLQADGQIWINRECLRCQKQDVGQKSTVVVGGNNESVRAFFVVLTITYTWQASQQLSIFKTASQRLTKELRLHPYKFQLCQQLNGGENIMWQRNLANHIVEEFENDSLGQNKIWFNDETHFQLNAYLIKQNWHHSGTDIFMSVSSRHCIQKGSRYGVPHRRRD